MEDGYIFEKKLLTISGMYPVKNPSIFYYGRSIITWFLSCANLVSQLIMMYQEAGDLSKITSLLYYCMTQTAFICKLLNFNLRKRLLIVMEEELRNPLFNTFSRDQNKKYLQSPISGLKQIASIFRVLCALVLLFYAIFPSIDKNPDNPLPMQGWYPFDIKKYRMYVYVFQVVSVGVSAFNNSTMDILTSGLITTASVQFLILKDNLRNMVENLPQKTRNDISEVVDRRLEKCVRHHNDILK